MTPILVTDLTQTLIDGTGIFDVLMRTNKLHLEEEFGKNRIKGTEYSTVYLGSLESAMRISLEFLLQKQKNFLESQLLEQQIIIAGVEVQKANAELAIMTASLAKIPVEIAQIQAQTELVIQQKLKTIAEQALLSANLLKVPAEIRHLDSQTALTNQQVINTAAQAANIPIEGTVLVGQKCKLDAEFDLAMATVLKTTAENALLVQKKATEVAQISNSGVDENSVIGRQKALYAAQTSGFSRDAEQKAAKIMIDTWSVRKTASPDDAGYNDTNRLGDGYIGSVVAKMISGVGA